MNGSERVHATADPDTSSLLPAAEVRSELARVLSSPAFSASPRRKKFLEYVVEQALAGRVSYLKAFDIAVDVLGRDETFDPQADPIVRIEAGRLRRDLDHYYLTHGRDDPIRISIPKGGYMPSFEARVPTEAHGAAPGPSTTVAAAATSVSGTRSGTWRGRAVLAAGLLLLLAALALGTWWWTRAPSIAEVAQERSPAIIVMPFETLDGGENDRELAAGLTNELVTALRRFDTLRLFRPDPAVSADAIQSLTMNSGGQIGFVIRGTLQQEKERFHLDAWLMDARSGMVIWSESFEREHSMEGLLDIQAELATDIARKLAQPYGIVHQFSVDEFRRSVPASLDTYACIQEAYEYRRDFDPSLYAPARACMEQAANRDPSYADVWAMLAFLRLDAWRFGLVPADKREEEFQRSLEEAERAYQLDPGNILSLQALAAARYFRGQDADAERLIRQALALNPNDPETLAQLAWRTLCRGNIEGGERLMRQAIERSVSAPPWYHLIAGFGAYLRSDYPAALSEALQARDVVARQDLTLLLMTYGQMGRIDEAHTVLEQIKRDAPWLVNDPTAVYRIHRAQPAIIERFLDGLRKGGLTNPVVTKTAPED